MRKGVGKMGSLPPVISTALARSSPQPAIGKIVRSASLVMVAGPPAWWSDVRGERTGSQALVRCAGGPLAGLGARPLPHTEEGYGPRIPDRSVRRHDRRNGVHE